MAVVTMLNQKGGVGKTALPPPRRHAGPDGPAGAAGGQRPPVAPDPGVLGAEAARSSTRPRPSPPSTRATTLPRAGHPARPGIAGVDLVPGSPLRHRRQRPACPTRPTGEAQTCLRTFLAEVARPLRPGADRLPAEPPPLLLGRPGRQRLPDRPAPARGLRRAGDRRRPGVGRPGRRPGPNPGLALLGYLITMFAPRRSVHQLYEERLRAAVRAGRLRRPGPRGGRLRRGDRPAAADRPVQAEGRPRPRRSGRWPTSCSPRLDARAIATRTEAA